MSTASPAGRRRTGAVMSLLMRGVLSGLGSLSFDKVVLGATMLWMAVAFIAMNGHTTGSPVESATSFASGRPDLGANHDDVLADGVCHTE